MKLILIPSRHVDFAWRDGAAKLSESCVDECTPDQLKLLLAREERQLVRMDEGDKTVGWGVFRVDSLPNFRVLHVTNLVAHNAHFERFIDELRGLSLDLGCSRIRCSAEPSQARLYSMKLGFNPVYTTLEITL